MEKIPDGGRIDQFEIAEYERSNHKIGERREAAPLHYPSTGRLNEHPDRHLSTISYRIIEFSIIGLSASTIEILTCIFLILHLYNIEDSLRRKIKEEGVQRRGLQRGTSDNADGP